MPTGYTARLDETQMSTRQWIMESLARAFGMCVMLKEDSMDMTEAEIIAKIAGESSDYHMRGFEEAVATKKKYDSMSDEEWTNMMEQVNEEILKTNQQWVEEAAAKKELHERAIRDLNLVIDNTEDEATINVCQFGLDQLKLVSSECKPLHTEPHTDVIAFKANRIETNARDLKYHPFEMQREQERNNERVQAYLKLRDEVKRILG